MHGIADSLTFNARRHGNPCEVVIGRLLQAAVVDINASAWRYSEEQFAVIGRFKGRRDALPPVRGRSRRGRGREAGEESSQSVRIRVKRVSKTQDKRSGAAPERGSGAGFPASFYGRLS